jgi:NADPH:quinone reductase-like Zn-dependent oxidoreductase
LVIGASGGCGLAAVSLARALGAAEIIGVCSGKNRKIVLERGATSVLDYSTTDLNAEFAVGMKQSFDVVYDAASGSGAGENYMVRN